MSDDTNNITKDTPENAIVNSGIARVIPCKTLHIHDPIRWLALAVEDYKRAPVISLFYGIIFTFLPWSILYLVENTGWHLIAMPAMVCFMLIGPFLAAGLYDVSWQFEKRHTPSLRHSIKAMGRNAVNEWAFVILLTLFMIFWLRVASLIHALYPSTADVNIENLLPFLVLGTGVGAIFTLVVFCITAFTQPILLERKVDLATAVLSSINAVWSNKIPMLVWAGIILFTVALGYITSFFLFIFLMPIIGYASWHGYIASIDMKRIRRYE